MAKVARDQEKRLSIGLLGNAAEILPEMVVQGFIPDVLTDQTSAHDPLNGYIPEGMTLEEANELRKSDPDRYVTLSNKSIKHHVKAMLMMQEKVGNTFDYANNIQQEVYDT